MKLKMDVKKVDNVSKYCVSAKQSNYYWLPIKMFDTEKEAVDFAKYLKKKKYVNLREYLT